MVKRVSLAFAVMVVALTGACEPAVKGNVVEKGIHQNHYRLHIKGTDQRGNQEDRWQTVTEAAYMKCQIGDNYPECTL